jgi:hypothetical protein
MKFPKEDLIYHNYTWSEKTPESVFIGLPSRRLFDRYNGEQMLFIINFYASVADKFTTEEGRKIEEMILERLPMDAKSEVSVFNWLMENFKKKQIINS